MSGRVRWAWLALACLAAGPAGAQQAAPAESSGGEVYVREAIVDGQTYRVQMQFFKVGQTGSCWNSVGRDAAGNVYFARSTQEETTYLHRLDPAAGRARLLGDLKAQVRFGGPEGNDSGKIHSGFMQWTDGCVYFPSHQGEKGELRYGGHFWRYDPRADALTDLGVPSPGNTIFCLSRIDPKRNVAYMVTTSSGLLIRYDFARQEFAALATTGRDWVRYLPMDNAGNVYIVAHNQVVRFDPDKAALETVAVVDETDPERRLDGPIGAFCWDRDRTRLFFVAWRAGNVFVWKPGEPKVEYLGKAHPEGGTLNLRSIYLAADGTRLYSVGTGGRAEKGFYMFDLATGKGHRLFRLDDMMEKEFGGLVRANRCWAQFSDYGGVIGDDGTMYSGFHASGRDQDLAPGGVSIVGLVAMRVHAGEGGDGARPGKPLPPAANPAGAAPGQPAMPPVGPGPVVTLPVPPASTTDAPLVRGQAVVSTYRTAARGDGRYLPLAWLLNAAAVGADDADAPVCLYVEDGKTGYVPPLDRHFLAGGRLRYVGRPVAAADGRPAYIDTSVPGGSIEVVLESVPAERLADCTVGKRVAVEGLIEPREGWMEKFDGEENPNWKLILTLPGGELIDIGDPLLLSYRNFADILKQLRSRRAVRVRVIGDVCEAGPYKSPTRPGTPKDVRGQIMLSVLELRILGGQPGEVRP